MKACPPTLLCLKTAVSVIEWDIEHGIHVSGPLAARKMDWEEYWRGLLVAWIVILFEDWPQTVSAAVESLVKKSAGEAVPE